MMRETAFLSIVEFKMGIGVGIVIAHAPPRTRTSAP